MKAEKYYVKIKLRRDHFQEKLDFYELKMAVFDDGEPEEFFSLAKNKKLSRLQ